jgi:membrane-bound metal-dependent hydrolase YbcI (DUF457 family)
MFVGHFALALGAKRIAPVVSLGTLFLACQFADLLWPVLVLSGVEHVEIAPGITAVTPLDFVSYPYSHSLMALVVWAALAAIVYQVVRGWRLPAMLTVAALVVSHWVLDAVTHRPDLPLTVGGDIMVGLGLWGSVAGTLVVEVLMLAAGVTIYVRQTAARDRTGTLALWGLIGFLMVAWLASIFGPPPPSSSALAWSAQAMWLLVAWGYWIDRHRVPRLAVGSAR